MHPVPRTPASVIEHLFTHANPTTGSRPPERVAWVVFEHGTVFVATPTDELPGDADDEALVAAAVGALEELGPAQPGTASADFNPAHLSDWFPGEFVYWIGFDHPLLATIVLATEANDLVAGLEGRARRDADLEGRNPVAIRRFDPEPTRSRGD